MSINVNWTKALTGVVKTARKISTYSHLRLMDGRIVVAEFLSATVSEAVAGSVDCLVPKNSAIPRSAMHTLISLMVPMLMTSMYFIFWFAVFRYTKETFSFLTTRCILSFMAVSYISYIDITETAVNVLSCIDVYDSLELGSNATHAYWAVDTSLRCYEGSHAVLVALVGWPVLVFFSFGFPAGLAALLVLERKRHSMENEWLFEATGFMYRGYKTKYIYWEWVIMLRKAILAVVAVFSYKLGGNLQGVLGVSVLVFSLYFQTICQPYDNDFAVLNQYEGLSLLICSLTFVSGLFFDDERTSDTARVLLTIVLFLVHLGMLVFFFVVLIKAAAKFSKAVLEAELIDYNSEKGWFHVILVFLRSRCPIWLVLLFKRVMGHPVLTVPGNTGHA